MPDATLAPRRSATPHGESESAYAWMRLVVTVLLSTIGGVGLWSVVVALPAVQADFHVARASASLPYMLTMLGFGAASIAMGRLSDRYGIVLPVALGTLLLGVGYIASALAPSLAWYALTQALLGAGSSATFARSSRTLHYGSRDAAALRWRSSRAVTTSPARSGRRSSSISSAPPAGGPRTPGSVSCASRRIAATSATDRHAARRCCR